MMMMMVVVVMMMMIMMMIAKVAKATTQKQKTSRHKQSQYLLDLGLKKNLKNPFPDSIFIT